MNDEPIAWIQKLSIEGLIKNKIKQYKYYCGVIQRKNQQFCIPLYTHTNRLLRNDFKDWLGLNDKEYQEILIKCSAKNSKGLILFYHLIEEKLKEKNTKSSMGN